MCSTEGCEQPVDIQSSGLCRPCYKRGWDAADKRNTAKRPPQHRMTSTDEEAETGVCRRCGPVRIVQRQGRWICYTAERAWARKWRHNLSHDELTAMLEAIGWRCESCSRDLTVEPYCIDHDHSCCPGSMSCGKCVRGILCRRCNAGIGMFLDDPELLVKAAEYLKRIETLRLTESASNPASYASVETD